MKHLVIVKPEFILQIQSGVKTVESRLAKNRPAAWNCVYGDELLFKASGGDVVLSARVKTVACYDELRPCDITALAELYAPMVAAATEHPYWRLKQDARFAVFIEMEHVKPLWIPRHALPRSFGQAWFFNFEISTPVPTTSGLLYPQ